VALACLAEAEGDDPFIRTMVIDGELCVQSIQYGHMWDFLWVCGVSPGKVENTNDNTLVTVKGKGFFTISKNDQFDADIYLGDAASDCTFDVTDQTRDKCLCVDSSVVSDTEIVCIAPSRFGVQPLNFLIGVRTSQEAPVNRTRLHAPFLNLTYATPRLLDIQPNHGRSPALVTITGTNLGSRGGNVAVFDHSNLFGDGIASTVGDPQPLEGHFVNETHQIVELSLSHKSGSQDQQQLVVFVGLVPLINSTPPPMLGQLSSNTVTFTFDPVPHSNTLEIVGGVLGAGCVIACVVALYIYVKKVTVARLNDKSMSLLGDDWLSEWGVAPGEIELDQVIGAGSFGDVYVGTWRGTRVAVKVVKKGKGVKEALFEDFALECSVLSKLHHPNIVQLLAVSTSGQTPPVLMLVMEYMDKGTVHSLLHESQDTTLDIETRLQLLLDAAKGMFYLHQCDPPVLHRDLKTANLLVDKYNRVKITDFGLSRSMPQDATMTACGTPKYAAPEVLKSTRYGPGADVWSFGVITWEVFANKEPYAGVPSMQVVVSVATQGNQLESLGDASEPQERLVKDCLSFDPLARPGFGEVLRRLDKMLGESVSHHTADA